MTSSGGESHSVSNVSGLGGSVEPSPTKASSSDHDEDDISLG